MNHKSSIPAGKARILLVDADAAVQENAGGQLRHGGCEVVSARSAAHAIDCLYAGYFDLVVADMNMPDQDGMELLRRARQIDPNIVFIIIASGGTIASAVAAIKCGAFDYLARPPANGELMLAVQAGLRQRRSAGDNRQSQAGQGQDPFSNIIWQNVRMAKVFDIVHMVADTRTTVLISGESGTGKSVVARAIHAGSSRQAGPFVEVSCAALSETLLESELFGHVRGAFTGAAGERHGKFSAADGGTIFLDEISTASPSLQVKLLRVLQEKRFEPVGGNLTLQTDARVILATNRDLTEEVKAGRFRADLYYRINVVNIDLPPLRHRPGDIAILAEHFLRKFDQTGRIRGGISAEALLLMERYDWPGNVRQLENCMERAAVLCRQSTIGVDDLPPLVRQPPEASSVTTNQKGQTLQDALAGPERQVIIDALATHNGSRQLAAAQLGINRCTLYKKMKKYGLYNAADSNRKCFEIA